MLLSCTELWVEKQMCCCGCFARISPHALFADTLLTLQVAYHASRALLQYVRAHLVSHMTSLQRRLRDAQVSHNLNGIHMPYGMACLWTSVQVDNT
jgi:hypothetical protein